MILTPCRWVLILVASVLTFAGCADRTTSEQEPNSTDAFLEAVGDRAYSEGTNHRTSLYISNTGALRFKNKDCSYTINGQIMSVTKAQNGNVTITYSENEIYRQDKGWISDQCRQYIDEYRATLPKIVVRTACSYSSSQVDFSCSENQKDNWNLVQP